MASEQIQTASDVYSELTVTSLPSGGYVVSSSPPWRRDRIGEAVWPEQLAAFTSLPDALAFVSDAMLKRAA